MKDSDSMLVAAAKNGDTDSFAALYSRYYKDIYHFALGFLLRKTEAEDAVSNAVMKAWEKLPSLRKNDSFKSWLYSITANECRNELRSRSTYLEDSDINEPNAEDEGFIISETAELLAKLPERERLIITLTVFSGYNSRETASILHMREGTVRSCKSRALSILKREQLQKGK